MYTELKIDLVTTVIRRESDKAFIPLSEENVDYQEYLKWKLDGNIAETEDISL
jgi:hypothetical protein